MKSPRLQRGKGSLELLEETVHLLRLAPASVLFAYYLGTLPFVLGLLFFWADMSRGSFAERRLGLAALGMALLFVWMKVWQAVFAQRLLARLRGEPSPRLEGRRLLRVTLVQAALQPTGLFLLPLAALLLIPFGWVYAFYQSVTALGTGDTSDVRAVLRRAWRQAVLWPGQNNYALLALKLFGLFVFINVLTGFLSVPFLLKTLLGIDTAFTLSNAAVLNTTFFAVIVCLTHLCMDPLVKTFYVLRCFYGESLRTGEDLRTELRSFASNRLAAAMAITFLALVPLRAVFADAAPVSSIQHPASPVGVPPSVSVPDLDRSINDVINRREFNWRLPRVNVKEEKEKGAITEFFDNLFTVTRNALRKVGDWADKAVRWIFGTRSRPAPSSGGTAWVSSLHWLLVVLICVLAALIAVMLLRLWKRRRPNDEVVAQAVQALPDVADENVGADQLPEDGWIKMARELIERGEMRLALRAFYLASLAHLAQRSLISLAKFKSNRDYERELSRRSHALPEMSATFAENVSVFDRAWYGLHEVTREMLDHFANNVDRIKTQT